MEFVNAPYLQEDIYLSAYQIERGLLIKFGSNIMEVKRLYRKH